MKLPRWISSGFGKGGAERETEPDSPMRAVNVTRGTVLATGLEVANTGAKRNKGLLGRKGLAAGGGLWIVPCESVHTFFMQFPIDLVYLDRKHRIRKVRGSVGPWRISVCLSAYSILELPAGTVQATGSRKGDMVEFTKAPTGDAAEDAMEAAGIGDAQGPSACA